MVVTAAIAVICLLPAQSGLSSSHSTAASVAAPGVFDGWGEFDPDECPFPAVATFSPGRWRPSKHVTFLEPMCSYPISPLLPVFPWYSSPRLTAPPRPHGARRLGIQEKNGVNVGSISDTRSVEASVTLNSVDPFYLASSSPDIFTMQLNTVLTHVSVLGDHGGV